MNMTTKRKSLILQASVLAFVLLDSCFTANADVITTLTLDGVTYADGGTATGSITLDYPVSGTATIVSFDVTLTSSTLADGYSGSVTMIGQTPFVFAGPTNWAGFIDGPIGPNNTEQIGIYGDINYATDLQFYFNVPNSLITGSPPTGSVQFDATGQGYDGGWGLEEGGIPPHSLVTGGTLDPTNSESTNAMPEPTSIALLVAGFFGLAASRSGRHGRRSRSCSSMT